MRVSALLQLSALAACPLALLTLNATGDSRVPSQPNSTPDSPEAASQKDSQLANLSASILPPEAFAAEAQGSDRPTLSVKTTDPQKTTAGANLPAPLYQPQRSPQRSPQSAVTGRTPQISSIGSQAATRSSPTRRTVTPESLDLSWDRVIARSVGLDESSLAAVSRAATPPAAVPSASPSQELLPEAAALDSQPADPDSADPAIQTTAQAEISADSPTVQTVQMTAQAVTPVDSPAAQMTAQAEVQANLPASPAIVASAATAPVSALDQTTASASAAIDAEVESTASSPEGTPAEDLSVESTEAGESAKAAPATAETPQPTDPASVDASVNASVSAPAQPVAFAAQPVSQTQPSGSLQASQSRTENTALPSLPARSPQAATPALPAEAIDQTYRLGPGDLIQLNFFNVPEYSGPQRVLVDGTVNLPAVGSVPVTGLTLSEAEQRIAEIYGRELRNIRVTVSLGQSRPLRVGVAGEVRQPGYYVLASTDAQLPSLAQAIQTAGGVTQLANLRQVQVRRVGQNGSPETFTVNLWALLEQGDLSQNLTLRDGDTIVIAPTDSMNAAETEQLAASNLASNEAQAINISLIGEVGRPGAYKLDSAAGNRATLTQAIQAAGGITPEADLRKVEVQRSARNGTVQTTTLDLWQLVTAGDLSQDLILQPGDRITVTKAEAMTPEEMARVTGSNVSPTNISINIVGEATSPGSVQVPANTTLNQALLAAGGFNRRARRTVQLIRINPNGTLTQREIQIDLERPVDSETNPILFNNDVIIVRRTGLARFTDGANSILEPFFRILPIFGLF